MYTAPTQDQQFLLRHVIKAEELLSLPPFKDFDVSLFDAVLEEAGKFASATLAPLNKTGDEQGSKIDGESRVTTPQGFKEAYAAFRENGWNAVPFPAEHGGQGLPWLVSTAVSECWSGANMAFALCPLLTQGSVELLLHHGTKAQQGAYLSKLISGEWTGTMCLTEPQAGSDVGAVRTKAKKEGDSYRISGQKIFITYGEHDFADNIIHMVLARLPDAPEGTKGISLFLVPKFLQDGSRNKVKALSLEHKMGIHASPTAIMEFDEAVGYLVGEENRGLNCMFTMMNNARLAVGVEGIAVAENSLQKAKAYAAERIQMGKTIDQHPDVKRMLLHMEANTLTMRALALYEARSLDMAAHHGDENARKQHAAIAAFLTPIVKAHGTDIGFEAAAMATQAFGGTGYIRETSIEQNIRDAKIAQIYEGTNGIQAIDLLLRKLPQVVAAEYFIEAMKRFDDLKPVANLLEKVSHFLKNKLESGLAEEALFVATPHLRLWGVALGAYMMCLREQALGQANDLAEDVRISQQAAIAYYKQYILPEAVMLAGVISQ